MKTVLLGTLFLLSGLSFGSTTNIKGLIAEVKKPCSHVVIKTENAKTFFVGKVTEGPIPKAGDSINGSFNSGHNFLDNTNQHEKFQFYTKGSFGNLSKAHAKMQEFCD